MWIQCKVSAFKVFRLFTLLLFWFNDKEMLFIFDRKVGLCKWAMMFGLFPDAKIITVLLHFSFKETPGKIFNVDMKITKS